MSLVTERVHHWAALTPAAVAVRSSGGDLLYGDLDRQANRLAQHLIGCGVGPESLVMVAVARTPELIVALLAVLRSGAAYLPVDPSQPGDRLAYIAEDSRASHLIVAGAEGPDAGQIARIDLQGPLEADPKATPEVVVEPGNLAYVVYTSGSTGRPKGVALTHRGLSSLLLSLTTTPGFGPDGARMVAAITTTSFDIAAVEFFLPLIHGGCILLLDRYEALDPTVLGARLDAAGATLLQATPVTWRLLLDTGWTPQQPITALSGGEALPSDLARRMRAIAAHAWNGYGPSETTIYSTLHALDANEPVSIGRPVANTQAYVLDQHLRPVPPGVTGELYIAGDGVGRGYLHQPGATARRFVPDLDGTGTRMYRSGDLVRRHKDGQLEFCGRNDDQVKINGHRIELGEIQSVLQEHAEVREVRVLALRADPQGAPDAPPTEPSLVAYLVFRQPTQAPTDRQLRRYLLERLPPVMLPRTFVRLATMPVNAHGKVDRRELVDPEAIT